MIFSRFLPRFHRTTACLVLSLAILPSAWSQSLVKRLRLAVSEPWHRLHPVSPPTLMSHKIQDLLLDRIALWNAGQQNFLPSLAEDLRWEMSGRHVDIRFRPLRTCSGRLLRNKDVEWSFEMLRSPDNPIYEKLLRGISHLEARPDGRLRFHFRAGSTFDEARTALTSFRIFAEPAVTPTDSLEGFGAYCVVSASETRILLKRNPGHVPGPAFSELDLRWLAEPHAQRMSLEKDAIDLTDFFSTAPIGSEIAGVRTIQGSPLALTIQVNWRSPKMRSLESRKELLWSLRGGWLSTTPLGLRAALAPPVRALAGKVHRPEDSPGATSGAAVSQRMGKKSAGSLTVLYTDSNIGPFLTAWQEEARRQGLLLELQLMGLAQANRVRQSGNFDLFASLSEQLHEVPEAIWTTRGAFNSTGFSDASVDRWFRDLSRTRTPAQRRRILRKIQDRLDETLGEIRIYDSIPTQALIRGPIDTTRSALPGQWPFLHWK